MWEMFDFLEIEAETIDEAVQWVKDHRDDIPLGANASYVDGTYHIDDGKNGDATVEETVKTLREYWDLADGIDLEQQDTNVIGYVNILKQVRDKHIKDKER